MGIVVFAFAVSIGVVGVAVIARIVCHRMGCVWNA